MRQILSTILRLAGLALGVAAGGILIALMWPDTMNDLYGAKSLRHFVGMFVMGIVLAFLINWPFGWVADKLSAGSGDNAASADIGSPT
jgi:prepilin signal peptidase PulO-like enzyme (type II secretory pathway)